MPKKQSVPPIPKFIFVPDRERLFGELLTELRGLVNRYKDYAADGSQKVAKPKARKKAASKKKR